MREGGGSLSMGFRTVERRNNNAQMVPGEFVLDHDDFRRIRDMIHGDAGIHLTDGKAALVYSRLAKRLRALQMVAFRDYCDLLESPQGGQERHEMLAALTTNVTKFYREPHHFEHLKSCVLPAALEIVRAGGRLRIWSAACSSGQEPYSIALTILSLWPDAARHDVRILATDIDPNMIAAGQAGTYPTSELDPVPVDLRRKYFEKSEINGRPALRATSEMRSLVGFRQLNLIGSWPMRGEFAAIFCRNVVIYFDEPTQQRIWQNFVPRLAPGASLYIGHSERVSGAASRAFVSSGISTYRFVG